MLGCLIEKQRTTPDAYPLSLNSLRLACNQSTNRDPVVDYDEPTIRAALERLSRRGWVRLASGSGSRAVKYRHLFDEALGLSGAELSLMAVLMLRGPQTPGELKQRTERLHHFGSPADVEIGLDALDPARARRPLAAPARPEGAALRAAARRRRAGVTGAGGRLPARRAWHGSKPRSARSETSSSESRPRRHEGGRPRGRPPPVRPTEERASARTAAGRLCSRPSSSARRLDPRPPSRS